MRQELARQDLAMDKVESLLKDELSRAATCQRWVAKEPEPLYGSGEGHEITF
jgi:hypothetical protein